MTNLHQLTFLAQGGDEAGEGGLLVLLIALVLAITAVAGMWKTFTKAGQPGWAVIIPIFNIYILLKIAGRPGWWLILAIITGGLVLIVISFDVAKRFGKGAGFGVGLFFLAFIFYPMLGFGDAQYTPAPAA